LPIGSENQDQLIEWQVVYPGGSVKTQQGFPILRKNTVQLGFPRAVRHPGIVESLKCADKHKKRSIVDCIEYTLGGFENEATPIIQPPREPEGVPDTPASFFEAHAHVKRNFKHLLKYSSGTVVSQMLLQNLRAGATTKQAIDLVEQHLLEAKAASIDPSTVPDQDFPDAPAAPKPSPTLQEKTKNIFRSVFRR